MARRYVVMFMNKSKNYKKYKATADIKASNEVTVSDFVEKCYLWIAALFVLSNKLPRTSQVPSVHIPEHRYNKATLQGQYTRSYNSSDDCRNRCCR